MTERTIYAVPTHLTQREPMVFGRTIGELAKLAVVAVAAARLASSSELAASIRFPAAGLVLLLGAIWALVRIQGYTLDTWLGLAFRFGARPKRRVWRPGNSGLAEAQHSSAQEAHGWFEVERVRLRWPIAGNHPHATSAVAVGHGQARQPERIP